MSTGQAAPQVHDRAVARLVILAPGWCADVSWRERGQMLALIGGRWRLLRPEPVPKEAQRPVSTFVRSARIDSASPYHESLSRPEVGDRRLHAPPYSTPISVMM